MDINIDWNQPEIYKYFSNIPEDEKETEILKIIEVGCAALNRIRLQNGFDFMEKKISELGTLFERQLEKFHHALQQRVDEFETTLDSQLKINDRESFAGKLHQLVNDHFGPQGITTNQIADYFKLDLSGKGGLGPMYVGVKAEIQGVRDEVMKWAGSKQTSEKTTLKGLSFEKQVFEKLNEIAKPQSDIVEDVSLKAESITNSKKGDYIYEISQTKDRIVIDAKNYNRLSSLPSMLDYIDQATKDRSCSFGIVVAPTADTLQKQIGAWNVYDNKIITTLEHIEVAIKFARYALRYNGKSEGVSVGLVTARLESLNRKMKEFSTIKMKLTKLSNGVQEAVEDCLTRLESLKNDVKSEIDQIEEIFRA